MEYREELPGHMTIDSRRLATRILYVCVAIELILVLLDTIFPGINLFDVDRPIERIFNLAREGSVGSWFGISQTMFIGFTAWAIAGVRGRADATPATVRGWIFLGAIFAYLAVDDASLIHERLGTTFKNSTGGEEGWTSFWPSFTWQLVVLPFFVLLGFYILFFLWRQLRVERLHLFVVAGLACFATAVGLDFVEGHDPWLDGLVDALDWEAYSVSHGVRVLEEFLEMLGMSLIWYALLRHFGQVSDGLGIAFRDR